MPAKLYLIPNVIADEGGLDTIPSYAVSIVEKIRYFIVEEQRSAQRLLKRLRPNMRLDACVFFAYNEHVAAKEIEGFFKEASGQDIGVISEAGCPCVADPGAEVVLWAHQHNLEVIPFAGPSSILLALMASGLNGQNFAFNGYLPKDKEQRLSKIKALEKRSFLEQQTQIFMETPYRNDALLEDIISCCNPETFLCVAADLTSPTQWIKTLPIREWKTAKSSLKKKPAMFLLAVNPSRRV